MTRACTICKAREADMAEILRLQQIAYQSEAILYNDYSIQPLTQTIEQAAAEFRDCVVLKAVMDGKIIGSVRAYEKSGVAYIGKLMVLPGYQNEGIGKHLLQAIESEFKGRRFELYTGARSEKNLALYEKCGYVRFKTEQATPGLTFVYMEKTSGRNNDLLEIHPITPETRQAVTEFISSHWFGTVMMIRGEAVDMTNVDGFITMEDGKLTGVITYIIRGRICEITSLDSVIENRGVGTLLVGAVVSRARELSCERVQLLTTNDNINAIGFYQKRGFDLAGVNLNAIDRERELKPSIPLIGQNGIPLRHEIDFVMRL